jgi:hypothetical protein
MMANEPRLSTADLRRRLHSPGGVPAVAPGEGQTPTSGNHGLPVARLAIPSSIADLPLAEDAPTFPIPHVAAERDPIPLVDSSPVPPSRFSQPDSRSSHHGAPTAPQTPQPAPYSPPPASYQPQPAPYAPQPAPYVPQPAPYAPAPVGSSIIREPDPALEQLRQENAQLHQLMEEMRQLLQDASEQEQRVQTELKDRDEKLATASARIEELETIVNTKPKSKGELEEWADELERESFQIAQERRAMETDRKQLREDESELEKQMREMEVAMARERAMLARQEQELKRLNAEIQHELEVMQRGDGTLRERLAVFQRRHAEVLGGTAPPAAAYYGAPQAQAAPMATAVPMPKAKDSNGLLRKLFRSGE